MRYNIATIFICLFCLIFIGSAAVGQTMGLIDYSDSTSIGYTLFTPLIGEQTYLVDQCGHKIHQWDHDSASGESVYLLDDGQLLRQERVLSETFQGGGIGGRLSLYDWDSNLDWTYVIANDSLHAHHDMAHLPNGNIAVIAWEFHSQLESVQNGRDPNTFGLKLFTPVIIELEPLPNNEANWVWMWRLWDHLVQDFDDTKPNFGIVADHPELMNFNFIGGSSTSGSDWMHLNALNYNPEYDQLMFSSRFMSEIYIIDHSTSTEEAASHDGGTYGKGGDFLYRYGNPASYDRGSDPDQKFYLQHDCEWVPVGHDWEGQISVFNNLGISSSQSSVDFITPPQDAPGFYTDPGEGAYGPEEFNWSWTEDGLFSSFISGAHTLENGNVLITEGSSGKFHEVTPEGEKIWEYICPISLNGPMTQGNIASQNAVFRATRLSIEHPGLSGQDLTPGPPLEFEPIDYTCEMATEYPDTTVVNPPDTSEVDTIDLFPFDPDSTIKDTLTTFILSHSKLELFHFYPNPVKEQLFINGNGPADIEIYDGLGQLIYTSRMIGQIVIETTDWQAGIYLMILKQEDQIQIEKILKS